MRHFYYTSLLIGTLFFSGVLFAVAATIPVAPGNQAEIDALNKTIEEKRNKVKQLEDSIAAYKQEISKKQLEGRSLSNQIAILDNRTAQIELDVEATQTKLDSLNLEIESLGLSIDDKNKTIEKQKVIIAELIRNLHFNQSKSLLEIFATYDNFSDFYNRIQYLETIDKDLGRSAHDLRIAREDLESRKQQREDIKKTVEVTKTDLVNKKLDLNEQINFKSSLLAQTHESEQKYQTLLSSLKSQYTQIEGEIAGIEKEVRKKLEASKKLDRIEVDNESALSWPTQSRYINAYFHDPDYPFKTVMQHSGIDIRAAQGTALHAAASGYVAQAKVCKSPSCYSYVMIIHSDGLATLYGHMSAIYVKPDQFVTRGDVIGLSGGTPGTNGAGPFVTGAHLHFEVRLNGIPVNALPYMAKDY